MDMYVQNMTLRLFWTLFYQLSGPVLILNWFYNILIRKDYAWFSTF